MRHGRWGPRPGSRRAHPPTARLLLSRGLLTERAAPVMNIIHSVFSLVLKFRSQLISRPWGPAEHPNFALMQQSYSTFKYYSHFLFKGEPFPQAGPRWGQADRATGGSPSCSRHPPARSGDQAGEPRLPATPGGLPAAHQLQQLLPGCLSATQRCPQRGRVTTLGVRKRLLYLQVPSQQKACSAGSS